MDHEGQAAFCTDVISFGRPAVVSARVTSGDRPPAALRTPELSPEEYERQEEFMPFRNERQPASPGAGPTAIPYSALA